MTDISAAAATAFFTGRPFSRGLTRVDLSMDAVELILGDEPIARINLNSGRVSIRHAGRTNMATMYRLNGILIHLGMGVAYMDGAWHLDGRPWENGHSWTAVA